MTWHTEVVVRDRLQVFVDTVRRTGGIITSSCPCAVGCSITYITRSN